MRARLHQRVGRARLRQRKYARNARANALLSIARREVRRYSLSYLHYSWLALDARRKQQARLLPDDLALARNIVESGEVLCRLGCVEPPRAEAYTGFACNLLGMHKRAVVHLTRALRSLEGSDQALVLPHLVDSLVRAGQREQAETLLKELVRKPGVSAQCRRLLYELKGGSAPVIGDK